MDDSGRKAELARFLRTRRSMIQPEAVGLAGGPRRRTPGLRREEVASLAQVGLAWYTWLEQSRDIQVSKEVIERIAKALRLSPSDTSYFQSLAGKKSETLNKVAAKNSETYSVCSMASLQDQRCSGMTALTASPSIIWPRLFTTGPSLHCLSGEISHGGISWILEDWCSMTKTRCVTVWVYYEYAMPNILANQDSSR